MDIVDQAARLRALDVLSEQHRRITALAAALGPAKRRVLDAAAELSWRSSSRAPFEERVAELADRLVAVSAHLSDALDQCERARATAMTGFPTGTTTTSVMGGYPATPTVPRLLPVR
jgi:hypothetical protein